MSDAIVRREGDALSAILGGGDTRAMLAQVEANVRAIVDISRQRGFITRFEQTNKKTGEVKVSEFYGLAAWQILSTTYGVTPVIEWVHPVDGGYQARAVAQTRDGAVVGAAEAFCHRKEPTKQYKSDHELAAVAQARAQRNALRSALGAVLVLAGVDFPDPEAPATTEQVGLLHLLERSRGLTHDEGHAEAGVESYRALTREQAAELIDRWQGEPAHPGDVVAEGELMEEDAESPGQKAVRETAGPEPAPSSTQKSAG